MNNIEEFEKILCNPNLTLTSSDIELIAHRLDKDKNGVEKRNMLMDYIIENNIRITSNMLYSLICYHSDFTNAMERYKDSDNDYFIIMVLYRALTGSVVLDHQKFRYLDYFRKYSRQLLSLLTVENNDIFCKSLTNCDNYGQFMQFIRIYFSKYLLNVIGPSDISRLIYLSKSFKSFNLNSKSEILVRSITVLGLIYHEDPNVKKCIDSQLFEILDSQKRRTYNSSFLNNFIKKLSLCKNKNTNILGTLNIIIGDLYKSNNIEKEDYLKINKIILNYSI